MNRDLNELTSRQFDLVVIGAGIFGVCSAWDAAQRGLSVAIIERSDFGAATSANSYKIVHGGIRYIQHGDVFRLRQSSNERRIFLKIAPHLVRPLPIVIPTYGRGIKGKSALRAGMALYDLLTADRNRGIADPARRIPWGRILGRDEVLGLFPDLDRQGLTGAAQFCDGQMYNPPRLVLAVLQKAVEAGALAANYVEATGMLREGSRITGVRCRDALSGESFDVRGRVTLNAAGPYAERLLKRALGLDGLPGETYSRDACFVVPRTLLDDRRALALQAQTSDPDAILSRGARHLFVAPWRDYTVVGTWHKVHTDDPDAFTVTDEELQAFLDEVNAAYPALELTLDDVSIWNAGLVPFGENPRGAVNLRYGHRSLLIDHTKVNGLDNLVTLIGVRFTTGRWEALRAIDLVFRKLGIGPPPSRTDRTPVQGGEIEDWSDFLRRARAEYGQSLGEDVVSSLAHNLGSDFRRICSYVTERPELGARIGNTPTIKAQVVHAIRQEMAQTLGDVVFRRTDLASGGYPGRAALEECAEILRSERPLSVAELARQIEAVTSRFPERALRDADREATLRGHASPLDR